MHFLDFDCNEENKSLIIDSNLIYYLIEIIDFIAENNLYKSINFQEYIENLIIFISLLTDKEIIVSNSEIFNLLKSLNDKKIISDEIHKNILIALGVNIILPINENKITSIDNFKNPK